MMSTKTLPEMTVAAEREVGMRKRVYPRWVLGGRMGQKFADHELACMEAIVAKLKEVQKAERMADRIVEVLKGEDDTQGQLF